MTPLVSSHFNKTKDRHMKKFDRLLSESSPTINLWPNKEFRNSLISNLTDVPFDEEEQDLLALGPKFVERPQTNFN